MEQDDLDAYLKAQRVAGEVEAEERVFTLSRSHALSKLAQFRDPFQHAWIVRAVQAAVALDPRQPIRVKLGRGEVEIQFEGRELDLESLERRFFDPDVSLDPVLGALVPALWAVGAKEGWSFQVQDRNSDFYLQWEDNGFQRQPGPGSSQQTGLIIQCDEPSIAGKLWAGVASARSRLNLDLIEILRQRCYPCPAPLYVDGRRLDSLLNCPRHGWGFFAVPIGIQVIEADLPELHISASTLELSPFQPPDSVAKDQKGLTDDWEADLARVILPKSSLPTEGGLAYLISVGKSPAYNVGSEEAPRGESWRTVIHSSRLIWVKDGVVLCEEPFGSRRSACSVAVFLSAEGLQTDLSGFSLVESETKRERVKIAAERVAEHFVPELLSDYFQELEPYNLKRKNYRGKIAVLLLGLGAVSLFLNPVLGVAVIIGGAVRAMSAKAHDGQKEWLTRNLDTLKQDLTSHSQDLQGEGKGASTPR